MSDDEQDIERFLSEHGPFEKMPEFRSDDKIGDWRVMAFLGRGATSEVYRCENAVTRQIGAVKVFMHGDDKALGRFRREVDLLAQIECAALPRFYGAGAHDGRTFLATELLEHADLPSKDSDVARFMLGICEGVEALHAHGYVHRDIKPCNVMRRPSTGEPVLIDIGLAKETNESPLAVSDTLSVVDGHAIGVGTIGYSAPEQFVGGTIGAAADVHALGMLANTCFNSRPPQAWAEIIRRSTSSAPEQRYATVAAFVRAVRRRHWMRYTLLIAATGICAVSIVVISEFLRREAGLQRNVNETISEPREDRASARPKLVAETATNLLSLGNTEQENNAYVTTIQLKGRDIKISGETILNKSQSIVIIGPGRLTASITGERGASIKLCWHAALVNLTTTPYPESSIKYVVVGASYLNFKNLDSPTDGDINNVWVDSYSEGGGEPMVLFGGPDSYEEARKLSDRIF